MASIFGIKKDNGFLRRLLFSYPFPLLYIVAINMDVVPKLNVDSGDLC
jgi:hypothetical protein